VLFSLSDDHAVKAYWGSGATTHVFLTSELDRITPRERAPGTHWIGG